MGFPSKDKLKATYIFHHLIHWKCKWYYEKKFYTTNIIDYFLCTFESMKAYLYEYEEDEVSFIPFQWQVLDFSLIRQVYL